MTGIEWTDITWNPTTGCDRISPGCDHCYALTLAGRLKAMGQPKYQNDGDPRTSGPGFAVTVHPAAVNTPLRWRTPRRVFVNSMSDLFHAKVPDPWIAEVFAVMAAAPRHTFQVLTKRPRRARTLLADPAFADQVRDHATGKGLPAAEWAWPLPHVWLGASVESDGYTRRADELRQTPAAVRFLSCEPLLGPLPSLDLTGIDWVIAGGESGPGARPMHPAWPRDLRDRCTAQNIPFFFKQWGDWAPDGVGDPGWPEGRLDVVMPDGRTLRHLHGGDSIVGGVNVRRYGKHRAGRHLDGRTWNHYPTTTAEEGTRS